MIDEFAGPDPAQTALLVPGIVAGLGLRESATSRDVLTLLDTCLALAGLEREHLAALASVDRKAAHPALMGAARMLGVPLLAVPTTALPESAPNPSSRVVEAIGLSSVAEAAALAFGPLLLEKQRGTHVTCALSSYRPDAPGRSSASSAASTLSTSSAGP